VGTHNKINLTSKKPNKHQLTGEGLAKKKREKESKVELRTRTTA
jgi:hypothetical protein